MVNANNLQRRQHPPEQQILAPRGHAAHGVQVFPFAERLLAHRTGHYSVRPRGLRPLRPGLALRVLVEPLRDAVPAKKVRAARQLRAAPGDVDLADLADELVGLAEQLVLLHLGLLRFSLHLDVRGRIGDRGVPVLNHLRHRRRWSRGHAGLRFLLLALLVILFLVLLLRGLFQHVLLAGAAPGRARGLLLDRGELRPQSLLFQLRKVEGVVHGVVKIHIHLFLPVLYVVLDALSDVGDFWQVDRIVVDGSQKALKLANMPPKPLLQGLRVCLLVLVLGAE
mmetsp:Transcript_11485/g.32357  ORF Transcript_11485/g.32357 Transcript_11485/m.32357 type:complete len:281 (+) Transcript_11485:200-1042(+)